jgi:hypothetical protein
MRVLPKFLLQQFMEANKITKLNVAGSRESKESGIYRWVRDDLENAFFRGASHPGALGGPER